MPAKRTIAGGLDLLDVRILREILQGRTGLPLNPGFRRSFRTIAREMKLDEDTIRRRVRRLEEIGFVSGWGVVLNPNVLGLRESVVTIDLHDPSAKDELMAKLKLIPGVWLVANFYGNFLGFIFRYDGEETLRRTLGLVQALSSEANIHHAFTAWPPCQSTLSKLDCRIIAKLSRNPRRSCVELSQDLQVSSRTIQRRLENLANRAMVSAISAINPKALEGTILANMGVGYERQDGIKIRQIVSEKLDDLIWHVFHTVPVSGNELQYTWFNMALLNVSTAHEISEWARRQPGVKTCRMEFYQDHEILFETFDEELHGRMAQT